VPIFNFDVLPRPVWHLDTILVVLATATDRSAKSAVNVQHFIPPKENGKEASY
jgi:hypothetical protein